MASRQTGGKLDGCGPLCHDRRGQRAGLATSQAMIGFFSLVTSDYSGATGSGVNIRH
jgi:hypothetical protein